MAGEGYRVVYPYSPVLICRRQTRAQKVTMACKEVSTAVESDQNTTRGKAHSESVAAAISIAEKLSEVISFAHSLHSEIWPITYPLESKSLLDIFTQSMNKVPTNTLSDPEATSFLLGIHAEFVSDWLSEISELRDFITDLVSGQPELHDLFIAPSFQPLALEAADLLVSIRRVSILDEDSYLNGSASQDDEIEPKVKSVRPIGPGLTLPLGISLSRQSALADDGRHRS